MQFAVNNLLEPLVAPQSAGVLASVILLGTGESLEGRAVAIAEGNALGKGPVVFELPLSGVALIRSRAAEGDPVFMQLEVRTPDLLIVRDSCGFSTSLLMICPNLAMMNEG